MEMDSGSIDFVALRHSYSSIMLRRGRSYELVLTGVPTSGAGDYVACDVDVDDSAGGQNEIEECVVASSGVVVVVDGFGFDSLQHPDICLRLAGHQTEPVHTEIQVMGHTHTERVLRTHRGVSKNAIRRLKSDASDGRPKKAGIQVRALHRALACSAPRALIHRCQDIPHSDRNDSAWRAAVCHQDNWCPERSKADCEAWCIRRAQGRHHLEKVERGRLVRLRDESCRRLVFGEIPLDRDISARAEDGVKRSLGVHRWEGDTRIRRARKDQRGRITPVAGPLRLVQPVSSGHWREPRHRALLRLDAGLLPLFG